MNLVEGYIYSLYRTIILKKTGMFQRCFSLGHNADLAKAILMTLTYVPFAR